MSSPLAARRRVDELREEADRIQAELAVAERDWQEWVIARSPNSISYTNKTALLEHAAAHNLRALTTQPHGATDSRYQKTLLALRRTSRPPQPPGGAGKVSAVEDDAGGVIRFIRDHLRLAPEHPHSWQGHDLDSELTMWANEDAIGLRCPRNAHASALLRAYHPLPGLHCGDVVFTGATDSRTDMVHGLTEGQALTLLDRYLLRINAHVPGARRH